MQRPPIARSIIEMQFAVSLRPCSHCGSTEQPKLGLAGNEDWWTLFGPCPSCQRPRSHTFRTEGNPLDVPRPAVHHIGDAAPSAVIRPGELNAELDRVLPRVRLEPERLERIDWYAGKAAVNRAITCLNELCKFVPAGTTCIPEASLIDEERADRLRRGERYELAWIDAELAELRSALRRYVDDSARIDRIEAAAGLVNQFRGRIDRESILAHEAWLHAGRQGTGRLEVVGYDATGARLSAVKMSHASLTRVTLDRAILEGVYFEHATLHDVSAQRAHMTSARLEHATIERGTFAGTLLALARFNAATINETDLRHVNFDRSRWDGATVRAAGFSEARFGNANLDGAKFVGCTFTRTDFRPLSTRFPASTKAVFEDCDLRGTRWDGRDLSGAMFLRCKLAGAGGRPLGLDKAAFVDPDLSPDGDGSAIGTDDDVRALLR